MMEKRPTAFRFQVVIRTLPPDCDEACLSPEERSRADRFVIAGARRQFVAARTLLRSVLGERLGLEPARVPLARTPEGKPFVAGASLAFSLSHSGGRIAVALSPGPAIGIDMEALRPLPDAAGMAARFLPEPDRRAVAEQSQPEARARAFLSAWTRHEAVAKALGYPLARLLAQADLAGCIHSRPLDLPPGWIGHVAADSPVDEVTLDLRP